MKVPVESLCARHYKEIFGMSAVKQCSHEAKKEGLCIRHYKEEFGTNAWAR